MSTRVLRIVFLSVLTLSASSAMALENCKLTAKRVAYPPGTVVIKVHAGTGTQVEKFSESKPLLQYLKKLNGKKCDVDWAEAKKMMSDHLTTWSGLDSSVSSELDGLIAKQKSDQEEQEVEKEAGSTLVSETKQGPIRSCDARLAEVKKRLSRLTSETYNSQDKRIVEIAEILKIVNGSTH